MSRVQTFDGKLHESQRDAKRHLDRLYGDVLLGIGRIIANQNYTMVTDYIDQNLHLFADLQTIKNDMTLYADEEDKE